jgi:hypothetical protein
MNTTTSSKTPKAIDCKRCKAPHFSHQLTCKRCGDYLHKADLSETISSHGLAVAGGILAVSTIVLTVCIVLHMF